MDLKVIQNKYGQFNLGSDIRDTVFSVWIYKDWEIVTNGENRAKLSYYVRGFDNREKNEDMFNRFDIEEILYQTKNYCNRIISTHDYKWDMALFIDVFNDNMEEIVKNFKNNKKAKLQKQIEGIDAIQAYPLYLD